METVLDIIKRIEHILNLTAPLLAIGAVWLNTRTPAVARRVTILLDVIQQAANAMPTIEQALEHVKDVLAARREKPLTKAEYRRARAELQKRGLP